MKARQVITWLLLLSILFLGRPVQTQEQPKTSAQAEPSIAVNSAGDQGDPDKGDGIYDTMGKRTPPTDHSGLCTLRAAIQTANYTPPRRPSPSAGIDHSARRSSNQHQLPCQHRRRRPGDTDGE
jgi:CSLREA domain-containing protein